MLPGRTVQTPKSLTLKPSFERQAVMPMSLAILAAESGSTHFTSAMKLTSAGLSALTLKRLRNA